MILNLDYCPLRQKRHYRFVITSAKISFLIIYSVYTHLYYDSGQSHQRIESIGIDHTIDHLMHQEAATEVGVVAEAGVTVGAWAKVQTTLGD